MSRTPPRRGQTAGPHLGSGHGDVAHSNTQSNVSDAESECSTTLWPHSANASAGALTLCGVVPALEQLVTSSTRQTEAFINALQLLTRQAQPDPAIAQLLEAQAAAQAEASRVHLETRRLKLAERQQANEARHAQLLEIEEARAARKLALLQQKEKRRAAEASLSNARREAAALAAAVANKPTTETAVALSTKLAYEIKRALRDATKCKDTKDWCSHIFTYNEFCTRHNLNDHMAYLHMGDTLTGDALLTWKGFTLQYNAIEQSAWTAHTTVIPAASTNGMPPGWVPPTQPPLFDWRLEFEKRVFFYSQFDASVSKWRAFKQGPTEPPLVNLHDLWLSHEKAFQSWGRFSSRITERDRVSQLLLCLSPRNRQYLLLPNAPDTGVTLAHTPRSSGGS